MRKTLAVCGQLLLLVSIAAAQHASSSWLRGSWEGTGYQTDENSTWTMKLRILKRKSGGRTFRIEYPSLNCGGRWIPVSLSASSGMFRELLDHGVDKCTDKGLVLIERKGTQLVFLYRIRGSRQITASAVLNRPAHSTAP